MTAKNSPKNGVSTGHVAESSLKTLSAKGVSSLAQIVDFVHAARKNGATIVTTNGCFDILHIGHIRYLAWAKQQGDVLIVGVNSDTSVRALKGAGRPITPQDERAELVAALRSVDAVFIFEEATPEHWLAELKPDVHVKGGDRTVDEIVEKRIVEKHGGKILLAPHIKGASTSQILNRLSA